jgi:hypothetical protein
LVDKKSNLGKVYEKMKEQNKFYRIATFYSVDEVKDYLGTNGFKDIEVIQTVFGELSNIKSIQHFKKGYGEGGFVVISATR